MLAALGDRFMLRRQHLECRRAVCGTPIAAPPASHVININGECKNRCARRKLQTLELRREIADFLYGDRVQALEHGDQKIDGLVEIAAVHDAVVGVGVAHGNEQADGRDAAVALLNFRGIVAVALDDVELQREFLGGRRYPLTTSVKFAIGERGAVVEKDAGTGAEFFLSLLRGHRG